MSGAEGLAKFGLFLFLAWIVPGMIYTGFVALYFPDALQQLGWDINSWGGLLGLSIFLGLLLTSICFAIEWRLLKPFLEGKNWEFPKIYLLGSYEARGLQTFYINQVLGQYTCHLNVSLGIFLLLVIYLIYPYFFGSYFSFTSENILKIIFSSIIIIINFYLGIRVFRDFSINAIDKYKEIVENPKSAVIFDLDNTLIDTYGVYRNAKEGLANEIRKLGGNVPDEIEFINEIFQIDRELGERFGTWNYDQQELIKESCNRAGCKNYDLAKLTKNYEENVRKMPETFDNIKGTLATLKNKGIYLVLLSERKEEEGKKILETYELDKIFGIIKFIKRKEKEHFVEVVKILTDLGYKQIYSVGDSIKKDIMLGNFTDANTVWIPSKWEVAKPEKIEEWPNYKVEHIKDILQVI